VIACHHYSGPHRVDVDAPFEDQEAAILGLTRATGAIIITEDSSSRVGAVPDDEVVRRIIQGWPAGEAVLALGVLAFPLTNDRREDDVSVLSLRRDQTGTGRS
jgi:hypothetical protein